MTPAFEIWRTGGNTYVACLTCGMILATHHNDHAAVLAAENNPCHQCAHDS